MQLVRSADPEERRLQPMPATEDGLGARESSIGTRIGIGFLMMSGGSPDWE
jgi:hypothetical protein